MSCVFNLHTTEEPGIEFVNQTHERAGQRFQSSTLAVLALFVVYILRKTRSQTEDGECLRIFRLLFVVHHPGKSPAAPPVFSATDVSGHQPLVK